MEAIHEDIKCISHKGSINEIDVLKLKTRLKKEEKKFTEREEIFVIC